MLFLYSETSYVSQLAFEQAQWNRSELVIFTKLKKIKWKNEVKLKAALHFGLFPVTVGVTVAVWHQLLTLCWCFLDCSHNLQLLSSILAAGNDSTEMFLELVMLLFKYAGSHYFSQSDNGGHYLPRTCVPRTNLPLKNKVKYFCFWPSNEKIDGWWNSLIYWRFTRFYSFFLHETVRSKLCKGNLT